jgi:hypothetical protein
MNNRTGDCARYALNHLDLADHDGAKVIKRFCAGFDDDVVGTNQFGGFGDTGQRPGRLRHRRCTANFGLDKDVCVDGHRGSLGP